MKKMLSVLAGVTLLVPVSAFAQMNYVGPNAGYKQPPQCTNNDTLLQETVGGQIVTTGCWTPEAMMQSFEQASRRIMQISAGTSVTFKDGTAGTCPWWFSTGCVVDPSIVAGR